MTCLTRIKMCLPSQLRFCAIYSFLAYLFFFITGCTFLLPGYNNHHTCQKKSNGVKKNMDELELQKIKEYSQYLPKNAVRDAKRDIQQDTIKIFYQDTSEFPEPIEIDLDLEKLRVYQGVYIGIGCLDPIHSDDCPAEYRTAMETAISYGTKYNNVIANHLKLKQKDVKDQRSNETSEFIGAVSDRHDLYMELRDIQPIYGGRDVWVDGSGNVLIRSVQSTAQGLEEKIFPLKLDQNDANRIIESFIAQDFVSLKIPEQSAEPDHARPSIVLINSGGDQHSQEAWEPPLPGSDPVASDRFRKIYRQFLRLETMARETDVTIYSGMYGDDSRWKSYLENYYLEQ